MTASPNPSSLARLFHGAVRAGFFAFLPGASVAGGLAIAPLLGAAGLLSARPSLFVGGVARGGPAVWMLLAFVAWTLLSSTWSPYPDHSQTYRLAIVLLPGLLFAADPQGRRLVEAAGAAALLAMIAMLGIEAFLAMPFNRAIQPDALDWVLARNPGRGVSVLVVGVWGVLGALLARGGSLRVALFACIGAGSAVLSTRFDMDANLIGFSLGALAFAWGFATPRIALIGVTGGLAAWAIAAPFITPFLFGDARAVSVMPSSWAIRGEIWRFASARILEQPWFGRGLDASRAFTEEITVRGETMRALPLHPHSFSLQVWLETGAVGVALAALALIFGGLALARAFRANRAAAAAAAATLTTAGLIANVSYGAWQEWWVATMLTGAALVAAVPRLKRR